jgi:type II secretory pathway pseudopilin PulG
VFKVPAAVSRQRGIILMLVFIGLFLVSTSLFLTVLNNNQIGQQRQGDKIEALREAKQALIAYAVAFGDDASPSAGPGHLFCPDTNNNGQSNSPCGTNSLGRLPVSVTTSAGQVVPLTDFGRGIDEQFWYAVADEFRATPATALNTTTTTALSLDGVANLAALLIAPGEALDGQSRVSNIPSNYLFATNSTAPDFVSANPADPSTFNDVLLAVSVDEIMTPVTARVASEIKQVLDSYLSGSGAYPDDASFDDPALDNYPSVLAAGPAWLSANDWINQSVYTKLASDVATVQFNGCSIVYTLDSAAGISSNTRRC